MSAMDTIIPSAAPVAADRLSRVHVLSCGRRVEYGDLKGLPVFALHGTPGSRLMFALSDHAARDRGLRLIAPERPGYGLSDYRHSATLFDHARDIATLAEALGFEQFAIIGVSGGGPYAVAVAAALPRRVTLLALVGPIADHGRQIRMSRGRRLLFGNLVRLPVVLRAIFFGLRNLLHLAPELAYRGLMARVSQSDRAILARDDVKAPARGRVRGIAARYRGRRAGCNAILRAVGLAARSCLCVRGLVAGQ